MAKGKGSSDKSSARRKKLSFKKEPIKDLEPPKDKDPKGGRFENVATPIEHTRSKT
jgi:hypothetical protein